MEYSILYVIYNGLHTHTHQSELGELDGFSSGYGPAVGCRVGLRGAVIQMDHGGYPEIFP